MTRFIVGTFALCVAAAGLAACGDDDDGGGAASGDVTVTLSEWIVTPEPTSTDAGSVTFTADNAGNETHELVVVKADSVADLPTDDDGAVDEAGFEAAGIEEIGEVEDVESGTSKDLSADLDAGSYVLFCNITEVEDDGSVESHFAEGMSATFTVN